MESNLTKEFDRRAVTRIRNLVTKKYGDATVTQIGYQKSVSDRIEGEIWDESGKQWTIRNGLKENVTKLDNFKALAEQPLTCPKCSGQMKGELNKKMWIIHKMCLDCVAKFETELKMSGRYEAYSKAMMLNNAESFLADYESFLDEAQRGASNQSFVTEAGDIEKWINNDNSEAIAQAREELRRAKESLNANL